MAVSTPTVSTRSCRSSQWGLIPSLSTLRTQAEAVILKGLAGAFVSFKISIMVNRVVESRRTESFDAFSTKVQLSDLSFTIRSWGGQVGVGAGGPVPGDSVPLLNRVPQCCRF